MDRGQGQDRDRTGDRKGQGQGVMLNHDQGECNIGYFGFSFLAR